nr:MAG TPA: hypothetical protein [Caudoviricetes sp.]
MKDRCVKQRSLCLLQARLYLELHHACMHKAV